MDIRFIDTCQCLSRHGDRQLSVDDITSRIPGAKGQNNKINDTTARYQMQLQ